MRESLSESSAHLLVPLSPLGSWMRKYNQKSANAGSVSSTNTFEIYICFILHISNLCKKSDKQWKLNTELCKDHFVFSGGNISNCNSLGVEIDCLISIYKTHNILLIWFQSVLNLRTGIMNLTQSLLKCVIFEKCEKKQLWVCYNYVVIWPSVSNTCPFYSPSPPGLDGGHFEVKWQTRRITTTSQVTPLLLFLVPWLMPSSLPQSKKSSWSSNLVSEEASSGRWDDLEWCLPKLGILWVLNCDWNLSLGQKLFFVCLGHKSGEGLLFIFVCFVLGSSPPCPPSCIKRDQITGGSLITDVIRDPRLSSCFDLKITQ